MIVTDQHEGFNTPLPQNRAAEWPPGAEADPLGLVISRLPDARRSGDGFTARCLSHNDREPSLSVGPGTDCAVVLGCFAGCPPDAILRALGFNDDEVRAILAARRDGRVSSATSSYRPQRRDQNGVTVASLAREKSLPERGLRALGLRDAIGRRVVEIPYYDVDGRELFSRERSALRAKDGSKQPAGVKLVPYGLEQLDDWQNAAAPLLVEGESDRWTAGHHGLPALGLPGASSAGSLEAEHVEGVARLFVLQEPDAGGPTAYTGVREQLTAIGWEGDVLAFGLTLNGRRIKDLNALHLAVGGDHAAFMAAFEASIASAILVDLDADQPIIWDDEEDPSTWPAAARARIAELEALVSAGSDGTEGCRTCQQRAAEERERRTWDLMHKRGGWALNPATVIQSYAQAAASAIAQGRATISLRGDNTTKLTSVSKIHHTLAGFEGEDPLPERRRVLEVHGAPTSVSVPSS